ncbi:Aquaporin-9 [Saitoella coloradoensis]
MAADSSERGGPMETTSTSTSSSSSQTHVHSPTSRSDQHPNRRKHDPDPHHESQKHSGDLAPNEAEQGALGANISAESPTRVRNRSSTPHPPSRLHKLRVWWEGVRPQWLREVIAEFVGTGVIVYYGLAAQATYALANPSDSSPALIAGFSFAVAIAIAVFVSGPVSGGHFAPGLTIAFALFKGFPARKVPLYILAQLLGAIVATTLLYGIFSPFNPSVFTDTSAQPYVSPGDPMMGAGAKVLMELSADILTALAIWAVLDPSNPFITPSVAPWSIGLIFAVTIWAFSDLSISANTARDTGVRIAVSMFWGPGIWRGISGRGVEACVGGLVPLIGNVVGAGVYEAMFATEVEEGERRFFEEGGDLDDLGKDMYGSDEYGGDDGEYGSGSRTSDDDEEEEDELDPIDEHPTDESDFEIGGDTAVGTDTEFDGGAEKEYHQHNGRRRESRPELNVGRGTRRPERGGTEDHTQGRRRGSHRSYHHRHSSSSSSNHPRTRTPSQASSTTTPKQKAKAALVGLAMRKPHFHHPKVTGGVAGTNLNRAYLESLRGRSGVSKRFWERAMDEAEGGGSVRGDDGESVRRASYRGSSGSVRDVRGHGGSSSSSSSATQRGRQGRPHRDQGGEESYRSTRRHHHHHKGGDDERGSYASSARGTGRGTRTRAGDSGADAELRSRQPQRGTQGEGGGDASRHASASSFPWRERQGSSLGRDVWTMGGGGGDGDGDDEQDGDGSELREVVTEKVPE